MATESGGPAAPDTIGPLLPFARLAIAVVQLHHTGHSSIVQRFFEREGRQCGRSRRSLKQIQWPLSRSQRIA